MAKKMLIDATHPEETRVVVMDGAKIDEFDFESINKRQLAGNIYLAKVTRVEPSLQAAFVEYGGNRHGFLAFSEVHPDYYQIPIADREALIAAEAAANAAADSEDARANGNGDGDGAAADAPKKPRARRAPRSRRKKTDDAQAAEPATDAKPDDPASSSDGPSPESDSDDDRSEPPKSIAESTGADETERVSEDVVEPDEEKPLDRAEPAGMETVETDAPDESDESDEAPDAKARPARRSSGRGRSARSRGGASGGDDKAGGDSDGDGSEDPNGNGDADGDSKSAKKAREVESVGAEKVEDEVRPRRVNHRRYKIQEVIKVRQILLVQVVKEERGNKGAALTTYLSLAGRYCVLMPNTARGGGISRKITHAADRKKLKEIAGGLEVPKGMGLIVRTAGAKRTKTEIKRDYEFLLRQWDQIRELTLASAAPALIYEEGSLIKRSIRDLYGREIDQVIVEGDEAYREAKSYMKMLMPSHARHVQPHRDPTPLFSKFQVESHLAAMFNPTVQLKSGGYIVIGVTEALVAIDVNSGRSTREHSIEETALKTNLEASDEIARQLRLRDLAGLIVIDYIDMDENRNNRAVEKRLKDRLKDDRARLQIGRISAFGLMEMSRQRLRPGMIEMTTSPCAHCHGTGVVRSPDNVALAILREVEEEGVRARVGEVRINAPVAIANYILNQKRAHVAQIEARYEIDVLVEGDPALISPDYRLEKSKGARTAPRQSEPARAITYESAYDGAGADEVEEKPEPKDPPAKQQERSRETPASDDDGDDGDGRSKRRRRGKRGGRRRRKPDASEGAGDTGDDATASESGAAEPFGEAIDTRESAESEVVETPPETAQKPKRKRPARRKKEDDAPRQAAEAEAATEQAAEPAEAGVPGQPEIPPGPDTPDLPPTPPEPDIPRPPTPVEDPDETPEPQEPPTPDPDPVEPPAPRPDPEPIEEPEPRPEPPASTDEAPKRKRRGWWS